MMAASLQRFGLERDRMRAALASAAGVSATDLDALEHLEADGPLTQRQLGDRLSLTSGAITMLVDRMEQAAGSVAAPIPATAVTSWSSCPHGPSSAPPPASPPTTRGSGRSPGGFPPSTATPSAASSRPPPTRRRPRRPSCAADVSQRPPDNTRPRVPGGIPIDRPEHAVRAVAASCLPTRAASWFHLVSYLLTCAMVPPVSRFRWSARCCYDVESAADPGIAPVQASPR